MSYLVTQTDEEAYADFAKRYGPARSDYDLARILSGRLRDLDKRTRAANKRADALERENAELRAALERSVVAIDDWLNLYASEHCNADRVAEAKARANENGTLWYIASTQEANRAALDAKERKE